MRSHINLQKKLFWTASRAIRFFKSWAVNFTKPNVKHVDKHLKIFSIDGHSSVVADLKEFELISKNLEYWNLSDNSNDSIPTEVINFRSKYLRPYSWDQIRLRSLEKFSEHYFEHLRKFNAFIVAHPSSFVAIYKNLDKPVLLNISTRYEHPLTHSKYDWQKLNQILVELNEKQLLYPVANNLGDKDYFEYFTKIPCAYAPSLCNYVSVNLDIHHAEEKFGRAIFCANEDLTNLIEELTSHNWLSSSKVLGKNYSWHDLQKLESAIVIPYNSSTMRLFELATLGVPVIIPNLDLIKELKKNFRGVFDQLSFFEVSGSKVPRYLKGSPADYLAPDHLEWWFSRSDFLNSKIMPNVSFVDSFSTLDTGSSQSSIGLSKSEIVGRNLYVKNLRKKAYDDFLSKLSSMLET